MTSGSLLVYWIKVNPECLSAARFSAFFLLLLSQVIVSSYSEITENEYLDPRTAQVAIVDHVQQVLLLIVLILSYSVL